MPTYVARYTYRTDEATVASKAELAEDHRAFIADLGARGRLVIAGPWGAQDPPGGLVVISAATREEADREYGADPYVQADLLTDHTVTEWRPVLGPLSEHIPA